MAFAMKEEEFKSYALYFSLWQVISQISGAQFGATLFRYGAMPEYQQSAIKVVAILNRILPVSVVAIVVLSFSGASVFILSGIMSLQFSIFNSTSELARALSDEVKVFKFHALPGAAYLIIFIVYSYSGLEFDFWVVASVEAVAYAITTFFVYIKIPSTTRRIKFSGALSKLLSPWLLTSLPLIPNNLIWYIYFNLPQIASYYITTDAAQYKEQAILFRIVVALSTFTSILSLAFQKKTVQIYEESKDKYRSIKMTTAKKYIPAAFLACAFLPLIFYILKGLGGSKLYETATILKLAEHIYLLSVLTWLFFSTYTTALFFVAEKRMRTAARSMLIGFVAYIAALPLLALNISVEHSALIALSIALTVTLTIRYCALICEKK